MKTIIHFNFKFLAGLAMISVFLMLWSCDANRFYDQSLELPEDGWHKDSTAGFTVQVEDTTKAYDFFITLRNNDDYPYRNFYLFMITTLPNQNMTRDTLELILADRQGKWLGKGFGAVKDNQIMVRKDLLFPLSGTYHFMIQQAMRQEKLKGITDVGIRITYAE